ncbi:o-succinylbenzoate--CoA ligase (fragment) [metagenome]|uniref:O-succinylbenzoate--CoA ligase n=1 Tax=metagenome TaxID=256318 RepID=A0A2P2BXQ0_9ZZZZ
MGARAARGVRRGRAGDRALPAEPILGISAGAAAEQEGPLYTSLVATQLHRLLETDPDSLRRFDTILLGGGPVDTELRRRAEEAGARIVATYGASETAGGCVYDGVPLDGVEVRIDPDGRICLGGPMLFDRYEGDPVLTREVLVDGWWRTSDLGTFHDGRLSVLGRVDDVVISGGVNVPTPAVAARLRQHPRVRDVVVIGSPDPEWGRRVVAVVVGSIDLAEARDWVAAAHPRAWAPREVRHVDVLPLLPNGKVDRRALT